MGALNLGYLRICAGAGPAGYFHTRHARRLEVLELAVPSEICAERGPLVVRDLAGRVVHEGQVETLRFQMDIEGWAPGRYTIWTATGASPMMVH